MICDRETAMSQPIKKCISLRAPRTAVMGVLAALLWCVAAPTPVHAAPARAATSAKQRALALFRKAEVLYSLGRFKPALRAYSKAYQTLQLPGFLFNIGQCHRNLENYGKALFFYRGYLRKVRRPANRALVLRVIKITERLLKQQLAARRVVVRPRLAGPGIPPKRLVGGPKPQSRPGVHKRWWFWTALVAGAAAVVGLSVGLVSMKRSDAGIPRGSLGTIDVRF